MMLLLLLLLLPGMMSDELHLAAEDRRYLRRHLRSSSTGSDASRLTLERRSRVAAVHASPANPDTALMRTVMGADVLLQVLRQRHRHVGGGVGGGGGGGGALGGFVRGVREGDRRPIVTRQRTRTTVDDDRRNDS